MSRGDPVAKYDAADVVDSVRLTGTGDEHAAQCLALEMLRLLRSQGLTVAAYNNLNNTQWNSRITTAVTAATLNNLNAKIALLSATDKANAANLGGNYFEHGYQRIVDSVEPMDVIRLRASALE